MSTRRGIIAACMGLAFWTYGCQNGALEGREPELASVSEEADGVAPAPSSLVEREVWLALAQEPGNVRLYKMYNGILGQKYSSMGKAQEAINAYKRALAVCPDDADMLNSLANVYFRKNEYENMYHICSFRGFSSDFNVFFGC